MKNYYAYIRVSTTRQGEQGYSLPEQKSRMEAYCRQRGITISKLFVETVTAKKTGRKVFLQMLKEIDERNVPGVVFHKIDRSARNIYDWAEICRLIDAQKDVKIVADDLDLSTRSGRLTADILAALSSDYIRNLSQEVDKGQLGCLKEGLYPWSAPVGYLNSGTAAKIVDPIRGPLVRDAFALYATGNHSVRSLQKEMTRRGLTVHSGKPLTVNRMHCVLRNHFYYGVIRAKGDTYIGTHQPIISKELFDRTQQVLKRGTERKAAVRRVYALRHLIKCGACSRRLYAETQKGHVYYRCQSDGCRGTCLRETHVLAEIAGSFAKLRLGVELLDELAKMFDATLKDMSGEIDDKRRAIALQVDQVKGRQNRLLDGFLDQTIDRQTFELRKTALVNEQLALEQELRAYEVPAELGTRRRECFLELVSSLQNIGKLQDAVEIRSVLLNAVSNCSVFRKSVEITWRPTIQTLMDNGAVLRCWENRHMHRTSANDSVYDEDLRRIVRQLLTNTR